MKATTHPAPRASGNRAPCWCGAVAAALLTLPACTHPGIPGATVRWDNVPCIARSGQDAGDAGLTATGLKAADDAKYIYLQILGYSPPVEAEKVVVDLGGGPRRADLRADVWRVTLDSDALIKPRHIIFSAGPEGTVCSDPGVRFAERRQTLEMAINKAVVATTPVHIRVARIVRLFQVGVEIGRATYPFPEDGPAIYQTPNLRRDGRVPRVERVRVVELECNAAVVQWESNKRLTSRIDLAPDGEPLKTVCDVEPRRMRHNLRLTKLASDTLYRFRASGRDFAGNEAPAVSGTFRTAVEAPGAPVLRRIAGAWREVATGAPPPSASADGETVRGVAILPRPGPTWKLKRELPPGRYRLSVYAWHRPGASPIEVCVVRSAEMPVKLRRIATIPPLHDGKLHHYDRILEIGTPFDEIVPKTPTGRAGPVTSIKLFESTESSLAR